MDKILTENEEENEGISSEEVKKNLLENIKTDTEEETLVSRVNESAVEDIPAYDGKRGFKFGVYCFFKRIFDIVASAIVIVVFSWLFLILAILVKCSDGGSVFYKHERVGKKGKTVKILKFRSMKKNADKLENMLSPEELERYYREYKLDNDPRITKIGKFLRRTSLDELPQVFDIFVGKLSVVGPRPLMKKEALEKYGNDAGKLLSVKPGMVGWWAANGRSNSTYESGKRQELELYYVEHCSVWLDIKTIFKTIFGVLKKEGAK